MTDMLERTATAPVVLHDGVPCPARNHYSLRAYRDGCRSAESEAAYGRYRVQRNMAAQASKKGRPELRADPRAPWRDGTRKTRVDRNNLFMLMHGFPDAPTEHELRAAVMRLAVRGNRAGTGLLIGTEIADMLQISPGMVTRVRRTVATVRSQRAERRLADVQWKARRVAMAERRRAREQAAMDATHRGLAPDRIQHRRAQRTMRNLPCRHCGQVIPVGSLYRMVEQKINGGALSRCERSCDRCALPLDGCGVCGVVPAQHTEDFPYVTPAADLVARRMWYRSELAAGRIPGDRRAVRDIWWRG